MEYIQQNMNIEKTKIPVALTEFLSRNNQIKEIHLHLDNDLACRRRVLFSAGIK